MQKYQIFHGGKWHDPSSGEWFDAVNPYDGSVWAQIPRCNQSDVDIAVGAADDAFNSGPWPSLVASERAALLYKAGDLLGERAERIAELETRDIGKRLSESVPQIRSIAKWFHYYAGLADKIGGGEFPHGDHDRRIPRRDRRHHPQRLFERVGEDVTLVHGQTCVAGARVLRTASR